MSRERTSGGGDPGPLLVPEPFARIVCGVNGTRSSRVGAEQALALAGSGGSVEFLAFTDVRGDGPTRMAGTGLARAQRALDDARATAREIGVAATVELRHHPEPRRGLLDAARGRDLLVLGGHVRSRAEGMILGSTAALALHAGEVPVLIARPAPGGRTLSERVMVATTGSGDDRRAAELAAAIAARDGAGVTILHADGRTGPSVRRELAEEAAAAYALTGVEPVVVTLHEHGADAIADAAAELDATLLVLGSRGLTGVRALASVSERAGARAPCSVLVVRRPPA